jgi:hypothetical protein
MDVSDLPRLSKQEFLEAKEFVKFLTDDPLTASETTEALDANRLSPRARRAHVCRSVHQLLSLFSNITVGHCAKSILGKQTTHFGRVSAVRRV